MIPKPQFCLLPLVCMSLLFGCSLGRAASGDENWDDRFSQPLLAPGTVSSMAAVGKNLYVAGSFCQAGNMKANNLAKWDGTNWTAWAEDLNGRVWATIGIGTNLYALGYFSLPGLNLPGAARWNGNAWSAVDEQMQVWSVTPYLEGLCLVGSATNRAGDAGLQIVTVLGTNRSVIGFFTNSSVDSIACLQNEIFVGMSFFYPNYDSGTNIMHWNGTNWSVMTGALGEYFKNYKLYADDQAIYAAGTFTNVGGTAITNLARWDGTNWQGFSTGLEFPPESGIASLAFYQGRIYASGLFGPQQHNTGWNLAGWNGTQWNIIPNDSGIRAILATGPDGLFAGGDFARLDGKIVNGIARWNEGGWQGLGTGLVDIGAIDSLAVQGSNVLVGGKFHSIGGIAATNLAKWDGASWSAVGQDVDQPVTVLHASETMLYAAGDFTTIGGVGTSGASSFDGTNWTALGTALDFTPTHFATFGTNLFVGGKTITPEIYRLIFGLGGGVTFIGGDTIRRWTGREWELVLTNINLSGLTPTPSRLVASSWTAPFGEPRNFLWEWRVTNFASIPVVTNAPGCLLADADTLYLAGALQRPISYDPPPITLLFPPLPPLPQPPRAGKSLSTNTLAVPRSGSGWLERLEGTNEWRTTTLDNLSASRGAVIGGDVFLADYATILRWDGVEWQTLGSGIAGQINALAASGNTLIVGGKFAKAGSKVSNGFALWHQPPRQPKLRIKGDLVSTNASAALPIVVSWPRAFTNMTLEESSDVNSGEWTAAHQPRSIFGSHVVITNLVPATTSTNVDYSRRKFFRLTGSL